MYAIERPFLQTFLYFLHEKFQTRIIWSAGQKDYVYCHIRHIGRYFPGLFDHVFHHDDCVYDFNGDFTKPLNKVYIKFPELTAMNTAIVDDRNLSFRDNYENGIEIPAYEPTVESLLQHAANGTIEDSCLLQLIDYFQKNNFLVEHNLFAAKIFTPKKKKMAGTVRMYDCPQDGNCFFHAVSLGINNLSDAKQLYVQTALQNQYSSNPHFRKELYQFLQKNMLDVTMSNVQSFLRKPESLRILLKAQLKNSPTYTTGVLEAYAERLKADLEDIQWLKSTVKNNEIDINMFFAAIADKNTYWADEMAITALSVALNIEICVWSKNWKLLLISDPPVKHNIKIHVYKHENMPHYSGLKFLFDM